MSNSDHVLDLMSILKKNYHNRQDKASLVLCVDADLELVTGDIRGNMQLLASAFGNRMRLVPEFNKLLTALMGAYLSQHPEERERFIKGLELTKDTPSLN